MYALIINGNRKEFIEPKRLLDLANELGINALAAKVNGRIRELSYYTYSDAVIDFVGTDNQEAVLMYESTLRYMLLKVLYELFPNKKVLVNDYISRTVRFSIDNYAFTKEDYEKILVEFKALIERNSPIVKRRMPKEELFEHYKNQNYYEKIGILKYHKNETIKIYECENYYNYMFSMMLPSTGYIKDYEIQLFNSDLLLQSPRFEEKGLIPEFADCEAFRKMIENQTKWVKNCQIKNISDLNEVISTKQGKIDFVNMCETKHTNMLAELGEIIESKKDSIKLIAIAGPSSSGKTTFCNRLRIELMTRGIKPLMISIDDYYRNRTEYPKDENGNPDFEHLESLDLELFNDHLSRLINGEEVKARVFDFEKGEGFDTDRIIKLEKGQPILIEGIHALNERLTQAIDRANKFKIYISPLAVLNFDNHNPVSATDIRMLRRIVRDYLFRGATPEYSLALWDNVRKGEFKWIYPFQDEADYTFNTELTYEMMVLEVKALPLLLTISKNSPYYSRIKNLATFMKFMREIDEKLVPCNSILREFIGGSCFYD